MTSNEQTNQKLITKIMRPSKSKEKGKFTANRSFQIAFQKKYRKSLHFFYQKSNNHENEKRT